MTPKLEVRGVDYSYHTMEGETKALSDISFHVNSGEFLCIVGPSGCGKSTLLSLLSGLLVPEKGKMDRISHWRSFWGIRAGLGVCLWIGLPRDFSIVPEDYGRSFPDSGPDAFLTHQRRRTAYQPDFMALIALQQKSPPDYFQRGFSGICQRFM